MLYGMLHLRAGLRNYEIWLSNPSNHQYTKDGNLKAPSHSNLLGVTFQKQWLKIHYSLTTSTDGSDDAYT